MSVTDPYSVPNINEVIRDKIIACGAAPLVTDMAAVNAYPVLFRQLLALLCCGECAGGGMYYYAQLNAPATNNIVAFNWGPVPTGAAAYGAAAALAASVPAQAAGNTTQFLLRLPSAPTAVFTVPAAAQAVNGGWIDSIGFALIPGNQYALEIVTNGNAADNTAVPFIITAPVSMVGYALLLAPAVP